LRYDYSDAPQRLGWSMVKGDIQRSIDGAFRFEDHGDETVVHYDLEIELAVPLPGFVKRRAERRILNAVKELKTVAEG
ncbi:MAG: cyclase, partial [Ilumatobacter coccineus]